MCAILGADYVGSSILDQMWETGHALGQFLVGEIVIAEVAIDELIV